jgi:hypothetical protein
LIDLRSTAPVIVLARFSLLVARNHLYALPGPRSGAPVPSLYADCEKRNRREQIIEHMDCHICHCGTCLKIISGSSMLAED